MVLVALTQVLPLCLMGWVGECFSVREIWGGRGIPGVLFVGSVLVQGIGIGVGGVVFFWSVVLEGGMYFECFLCWILMMMISLSESCAA